MAFSTARSLSLLLISSLMMTTACQSEDPLIQVDPPGGPRRSEKGKVQSYNSKIDILFVIDDSGSMWEHQQNLSKNVDLFINEIASRKHLDYHIGVISTAERPSSWGTSGPGAGRLSDKGGLKFITRHTPNGMDILRKNMLMGTNGSATEMLFSPTYLALTEPNLSGWNKGFYRREAFFALIYISDAEDQSDETEWGTRKSANDPTNLSPRDFLTFLMRLKKNDPRRIMTYGAIIPENDTSRRCGRDSSNPYLRIYEFFRISKGLTYGLCDPDYGVKLAGLGKDIARRTSNSLILDRLPKIDTIEVIYGTQVIPPDLHAGWSYEPENNAITFGQDLVWSEQLEGTEVEVFFDPL